MSRTASISYLDAPRLLKALQAGIGHLFERREYLNRINVFPVPDGDTGTNMAFTFKSILDATHVSPDHRIDELAAHIADAALDGARGNSGAIMAQFFHGFSDAVSGQEQLDARDIANASHAGAKAAWTAMSEPVAGTLPTVLEDFAAALMRQVDEGEVDIQQLLRHARQAAQQSLDNTPNQLAALRLAGVVDAGGQGFVDLLDGIWTFIESGQVNLEPVDLGNGNSAAAQEFDVEGHQFCTECVIEGQDIDREAVMRRMQALDSSSLVVAGGGRRVRVHVHVDNPGEVFLACELFGKISQQKAEDMKSQHGLLDIAGQVAVVADSAADLPDSERERLGITVVPVRLSFGDREYLDGVSLDSSTFYDMLRQAETAPLTSQPPPQDFKRVYALLTSHGYDVISVGLSEALSGTTAAARQGARHFDAEKVRVLDTFNASCGQGLLSIIAAEAAQEGKNIEDIESLLLDLIPQTRVFAVADDLSYAVKGGRVPAWFKSVASGLRLNPVLTASPKGKLVPGGFIFGRGANIRKFARKVVRQMEPEVLYRVMVSHADNEQGARSLRQEILERHGRVHSCLVADAGPALGVHLGPRGLIAGFVPH